MKKILINKILIGLLFLLIVYELSKTFENMDNDCPTKEEVEELQAKNEKLSQQLDDHQDSIDQKNDTIQEMKTQNIKDFCTTAQEKFEDLNNQVKDALNNIAN